jgi:hypothetical protein
MIKVINNLIYFVYDLGIKHLPMHMLSEQIYLPSSCSMELRLNEGRILQNLNLEQKESAKLLIKKIQDIELKIIYLLNSKFSHGSSRFISLFKQLNLRFINGKLIVSINSYEDLLHIFQIAFFLDHNKRNCESFIDYLDSETIIVDALKENSELYDINDNAAEYINGLYNSSDPVPVITIKDEVLYLKYLSVYDVLDILYKYNVVLLNGKISNLQLNVKYKQDKENEHDKNEHNFSNIFKRSVKDDNFIICLDEKLTSDYSNSFDNSQIKNAECQIINAEGFDICIGGIESSGRTYIHFTFSETLIDLLQERFSFSVNENIPQSLIDTFNQNRYLSEMTDNVVNNDATLIYNKDNGGIIVNSKLFKYSADIFNLSLNSISCSFPWCSLELGVVLTQFNKGEQSSSICYIQEKISDKFITKYNKSIKKYLTSKVSIITSFFFNNTSFSDTLFSKSYIQGVVSEDGKCLVLTHEAVGGSIFNFMYTFHELLYTSLNKFVHLNNNFWFKNIGIKASKKYPILFDANTKNITNFSIDDLDQNQLEIFIFESLNHGFHEVSLFNLFTNFAEYISKNIFGNKFVRFSYLFNRLQSIKLRNGIRNWKYSYTLSSAPKVYSFISHDPSIHIFKETAINSSIYYNCEYAGSFVNLLATYDNLFSHNSYVNGIEGTSHTSGSAVSIILTTSELVNKLFLKNSNFRFENHFMVNAFEYNSNIITLLQWNKVLDTLSVQLTLGSLVKNLTDNQELRITTQVNPSFFISNNFVYMLTNYNSFNETKQDLCFSATFKKEINKHIMSFTIYNDVLLTKNNKILNVLDVAFQYWYKLFTFFGFTIAITSNLSLHRDNSNLLSLTIV